MNSHIIIMFCSVLWYLCVLIVWVWLGRSMNLFGNHSVFGWFMIGAAFVSSLAGNFLFNPLAWVIAALSIKTAKAEETQSVWRFYPLVLGIILVGAMVTALGLNIVRSQKSGTWRGPQPESMAGVAANGEEPLAVMGIMFSDDPSALINNQVVKKGQMMGQFEVVEIRENAVVFRDPDGRTFEERVK